MMGVLGEAGKEEGETEGKEEGEKEVRGGLLLRSERRTQVEGSR